MMLYWDRSRHGVYNFFDSYYVNDVFKLFGHVYRVQWRREGGFIWHAYD